MELPKRKPARLKDYDYSRPDAYFVTLCTKDRCAILSKLTVRASTARQSKIELTEYGEIIRSAIKNIPKYYPAVSVDNFVIMPDHIHLLLQIYSDDNGRPMVARKIHSVPRMRNTLILHFALSILH